MRKLLILTAVLATAVFVLVAVTLPPWSLALTPQEDGTIAGILHVHTNRSDGLKSPDEVAAAAARAGLKFIIFTDHGDATRTPDPPMYRSGVLCLDGVEISTNGGHYVAIDMPAAPYPLAGDARDVVEDVRRLGGFGIVAHPDSPKPQLRWLGWDTPFDGIELLNPDTSWRVLAAQPGWQSKRRLMTAFVDYAFRPSEVIAALIQPTGALERWVSEAGRHRVVAIAGADAHSRLTPRSADPVDSWFALPVPGYEASFRVMSVHARLERPLRGDARGDTAVLMRAIRNGHLYTAVDALASPPSFDFTATNSQGTVREGDELGANGPVQLHVRSNAPPGFMTIVHEGAQTISSVGGTQDLIVHASPRPAVYWVEIVDPARAPAVTWVRSNPIYVRDSQPRTTIAAPPHTVATLPAFDEKSTSGWRVEHDPLSAAEIDITTSAIDRGVELRFRYGLAGGPAAGQVAALVLDTPAGTASFDQLALTVRAERPMRISVQLRDASSNRWKRSVYLEPAERERTVAFDDLVPVGTAPERPSLPDVRSILLVVDTTNAKPGSSGRVWIRGVGLQKVESYVRTVSSIYTAAAPKRMFGAHAASIGPMNPAAPSAPKTLSVVQ